MCLIFKMPTTTIKTRGPLVLSVSKLQEVSTPTWQERVPVGETTSDSRLLVTPRFLSACAFVVHVVDHGHVSMPFFSFALSFTVCLEPFLYLVLPYVHSR